MASDRSTASARCQVQRVPPAAPEAQGTLGEASCTCAKKWCSGSHIGNPIFPKSSHFGSCHHLMAAYLSSLLHWVSCRYSVVGRIVSDFLVREKGEKGLLDNCRWRLRSGAALEAAVQSNVVVSMGGNVVMSMEAIGGCGIGYLDVVEIGK
ncbi:hypothetical protein Dimus_026580 [Dionaea muscipula]